VQEKLFVVFVTLSNLNKTSNRAVTSVAGTSLQQNDFNKEIHKDKAYETIDNTYEDLSIEMPKAQTL